MDKNLNKEEQKKVGNLIKCLENCKSNIGYLKSFKPEDVEVYRNGNEELVIKHKEFDRIKITIGKDGNYYADSGSRKGKDGSQNQFLNVCLSNATYIVDKSIKFCTDDLGRTFYAEVIDMDELQNQISNRAEVDKKTQKSIRKNGNTDDESGHIIAKNLGGPNEAINQIAMKKDLNRGKWKSLENNLSNNLKDLKYFKIKVFYEEKSKRPIEFDISYTINIKN